MNTSNRRVLLWAAALLLSASAASAQTTGRIIGTIKDPQGAVLPGATVTASSPALQGEQTQVTDQDGSFRFLSLPVGRYVIKVDLSGFRTIEQPDVQVGLDRTVDLQLSMQVAGVAETVNVTSVSPTVDTTSTTIGVNANADLFERLPVRRDVYAVARIAPGTTEDTVGPAVLGSTGAENQYIIEGLNTTGIERGERTKRLNFDFIDEVELKTGGLPAEYGRMTGGIINVITKSGGNTFTGSLFGFTEGGGLMSDDSTESQRPQTSTTVTNLDSRWDVGFQLGGFIVRDRLWFFGAYNPVSESSKTRVIRQLTAPGSPSIGTEIGTDTNRHLSAAKLTYRIGTNSRLVGAMNADPSKRDGALFVVSGPESTWRAEQKTGALDPSLTYDATLGASFNLRAIVGRHSEKTEYSGAGKLTPLTIDQRTSPNPRTGGFGAYFQDSEFTRDIFKVDATKFLGGHEIKAGVDWELQDSSIDRYAAGGGMINYILPSASAPGGLYYRHRFYVNDQAAGFDADDATTWTPAIPLITEPQTDNSSFYLQDSWRATSNLTINAGVRWERQQIGDRDDQTVIDLTDNWAPRFGVIWDFARNGRSKLFANYGRFYESIPMDINIRAFGGESTCFCYNFDPNPMNFLPNPAAPARSTLLGGHATPVDPNLKGQYSDEWIVGTEYEVARNLSVSMKYVRRNLGRVIEDFLVPAEGEYFIANPGVGLGNEMSFYDYTPVAAPKVKRLSNNVELSARKRFSDGWQFVASYVWQRMEGNYDGLFQNSTGQLDPNINSAFDYADFLINAEGRLTNDRTHQWKLDGSYEFQKGLPGLNLGLSTYYFSGTPLNAYGYSIPYANWEYFLVPRGTIGRGPSEWEANFQAGYPIRFGDNRRVNLIFDVFNMFNRQAIITLDERYNLAQHGRCAGIPAASCNGDNQWLTQPGTLTPVGTLSDPRGTAPNVDYLKAGTLFTQPRSIRLGIRFQW
jgi:outer membrane receptor protein involved in Fe transport